MFEKLCDTLNILMAERRINANELAKCTGLPASTIKKIRNRDNPNPTLATLLPLTEYFSISLSQLVGFEPLPKSIKIKKEVPASLQAYQVPLLSWEEAIIWPDIKREIPSVIAGKIYSDQAYALTVAEEGLDHFAKGSIIIIDPLVQFEHRDIILALKVNQKTPSLKQIIIDDEHIYLKSIIPGCPVNHLTSEHKILGVVVECRRMFK